VVRSHVVGSIDHQLAVEQAPKTRQSLRHLVARDRKDHDIAMPHGLFDLCTLGPYLIRQLDECGLVR
jgi:hypothetical protein